MKNFVPLPRPFYEPSAAVVAPRLLGHWLIRNTSRGLCGGTIVETEAYLAGDPACHGYAGETARNRSMYGPPGHAYVYFTYGMHFCFNAVCRPRGAAEAVLIRAVAPVIGEEIMRSNRSAVKERDLTNGPAKLCAALGIDRSLDGVDLCAGASPLFIARNSRQKEFLLQAGPMITTTRIGISRAAERPLRFYLAGSSFISRRTAETRERAPGF